MSEYRWPTAGLSENAVDAIAKDYGMYIAPGGKELVSENMTDTQAPLAEVDIAFAKANPSLPIENVCSRLDNYTPQNESQTGLLAMATKLANYRNPSRLAGFIACGSAGLGKTHISVGVAKHAMLTGQEPFYINVPTDPSALRDGMSKAVESDIVVIDDVNQRYTAGFDTAQVVHLLGAMHNKGGGKLMITSNSPNIQTFLDNILLPCDPTDRVRVADRVASSLLGLEVVGDSFRAQSAVGQKPWWEE